VYLAKAGDKARAAFANVEAVHFYESALAAAGHLEPDADAQMRVYHGLGIAHFRLSQFPPAVEAFRRGVELASGDSDRAQLEAELAEALTWAHDLDAALEVAAQANALAKPGGYLNAAAKATSTVALIESATGKFESSLAHFAEARGYAERVGDHTLCGEIDSLTGTLDSWRGDYGAAIAIGEKALASHKKSKELLALVKAHSCLTVSLGGGGFYARALAVSAEGVELADLIGDKVWCARMWNTRGWIFGELGNFDAAYEANRRCLELATELGSLGLGPELVGNAQANLADVAIGRSELGAAEPHLEVVAGILADPASAWMGWRYGMHFQASTAELMLERGEIGRARDAASACLAAARRTQSRRYIVRGTILLAACHLAEGDLTGAERLLAVAKSDARSLGNPPQLWRVLLAYGQVVEVLGRREEARSAWREGLHVVEATADVLSDEDRELLRRSAAPAALAELA
jgi:tetratricopeptide (TPR) repeat protein